MKCNGNTDGRWRRSSQNIALQVRNRMAEAGITQMQLAQALGCSQQYISTILKGTENLTLETICRLEDVLGTHLPVTTSAFVEGYGQSAYSGLLSDSGASPIAATDLKSKTLYIIAGCNGAGKTTASVSILPDLLECRQFVNADEIARGLSPFNPESVAIQAGRLMLERIDTLLQGDESFAIETTLSTRSYVTLVERAHKKGFTVKLLFFWLPSPRQAMLRVARRVREGGHDIPADTIVRRYNAGLSNLFKLYMPIVDSWVLVDNHSNPRRVIAQMSTNKLTVNDKEKYEKIDGSVR